MVQPHHVGAVRDRRSERRQHPRCGIGDLVETGDGLGTRGRSLGIGRRHVDRRTCRTGRIAQRGQISRQLVVEAVDAARGRVLDRRGEPGGRPFPPLHEFRFDQPGDAPGGDPECGRRQFAGGHAGYSVHQIVRLVDDQQLVFGQHGRVGDGVDGQQRVVGDDNISPAGFGSGAFGEAFGAERAARHAEAFPRGHADL